jgi:hypothetical protein
MRMYRTDTPVCNKDPSDPKRWLVLRGGHYTKIFSTNLSRARFR